MVNRNRIIVRFSLLFCITLCALYATRTTFEYNGSSEQYKCGNTKLCKISNYTIESTKVNVSILRGINFKNVDISPEENLFLLTLNSGVDDSEENVIENLKSDFIPMNVHYFWCDQRWFEFKHYLSVMSVIRFLKPDKIVFHYEHFPVVDRVYYHQWIDNLIHDYPFFIMEQMTSSFCASDRESQISSILKILNEEGGLYVSINTLMLRLPNALRLSNLVRAVERTTVDGFILQRSAIDLNSDAVKNFIKGGSDNTSKIIMKMHKLSCMPAYHANSITHQTTCIIARDGNYSTFYPMNIWELNTTFGRLCRKIFYGTSKIRLPEPTNDQLVPNIGHMIWNGGGEMNFLFYLSVLSLLYVAKVDKVFIHGDIEIKGQYWQSLKQRESSRLEFIKRTQPRNVFQDKIEPWFLSLMSDIVRVDIMIKYGGIYTDTDAIWVCIACIFS